MQSRNMAPYLMRAYYDWMVDSGMRPYLQCRVCDSLDASDPSIIDKYAKDGEIIFNVDPTATGETTISDKGFAFSARFSGVSVNFNAGWGSIMRLYAKGDGVGIQFGATAPSDPPAQEKPKPKLTLVK